MKKFLKSISAATVIAIIFSLIPFGTNCESVRDKVFRLHILANSDSVEDQSLKLQVRDAVLDYTREFYKNADSVYEAKAFTNSHLQDIANAAKREVERRGFNYTVRAQLATAPFDTRTYGEVVMPAGEYEALRITIGSGEGHNWWCVMYPQLCVGAATDYSALKNKTEESEYKTITGGYTYKFIIVEYFEKIRSFFF